MQFVKELSGLPTDRLRSYLDKSKIPFETSALYEVASASKKVDKDLRLSKFRSLVDPEVLAIAKELVDTISALDPLNDFSLVPNDVTHIIYTKGGFFKSHTDYLSLFSNVVTEYTLLINVNASGTRTGGGETRIEITPESILTSKATVTRGGGLLFRKDLSHEGLPITSGEKQVVSINVLCSRKSTSSSQLIEVKFREGGGGAELPPLEAVAKARSYVISADVVRAFPSCVLNGKINFDSAAMAAGGGAGSAAGSGGGSAATHVPPCIVWECSPDYATFEEFNTVFRVLHGLYVRPSDLIAHGKALNFFGIPLDAVLVDIANAGNAGKALAPADGAATGTAPLVPLPLPEDMRLSLIEEKKKTKTKKTSRTTPEPLADADVIICTTPERTTLVANTATSLRLPYVRFHVIFAEGTVTYGGEMTGTMPAKLIMQPVWASVGDYSNILAVRTIIHKGEQDKVDLSKYPIKMMGSEDKDKHSYKGLPLTAEQILSLSTPGREIKFTSYGTYEEDDKGAIATGLDSDHDSYWVALKYAPVQGGDFKIADIIRLLMPDDSSGTGLPSAVITLPGVSGGVSGGGGGESISAAAGAGGGGGVTGSFFHLDETGATCFTAAEAEAASALLVDTAFLEHLQNRISSTTFHLPQQSVNAGAHFCNENVYGKMNLLSLTGVVRLDSQAATRGAAGKAAEARAVMASADAEAIAEGIDVNDFDSYPDDYGGW